MAIKNKFLSFGQTEKFYICRILGIKIRIRKSNLESIASKVIQDTLDLTELSLSKKVIVFMIPHEIKICGGIMSIFSLCEATRNIVKNAFCCLSTYPNTKTYVINDKFLNNEKVLRFDQIVNKANSVEELILHIPEYWAKDFYGSLNQDDIKFLRSVSNLHINIMNQNIDYMPNPEELKDLYKLTDNITQTIAHDRYATQEVCNKWNIPTHLFSVNIDLSRYKTYSFDEKEKIIVLSPDVNEYKEEIVNKLKRELPDWSLITVNNMTFSQYMNLIGRSYFTITFGEGMDGYFNQPVYVGGLGFCVYNDKFFPDKSWDGLRNVYSSYEEMLSKICIDFKELSLNEDLYYETNQLHLQKLNKIYKNCDYLSNIKRFYNKEYSFVPKHYIRSY